MAFLVPSPRRSARSDNPRQADHQPKSGQRITGATHPRIGHPPVRYPAHGLQEAEQVVPIWADEPSGTFSLLIGSQADRRCAGRRRRRDPP